MRAYVMQIRQGKPDGGGKGPLVKYEHAPCLSTAFTETLFLINNEMETIQTMKAYSIGGGGVMPTLISSDARAPTGTTQDAHCIVMENEMETETFIKTTHAKGKDGLGEKWERGDVVGSRNCFDNGDTRTQEAICYEHHPQDTRVKPTDVAPTCGTFGNSIEGKDCLVMNGETYSIDQGGGKSSCSVYREVSPTTTTTHQGEPVVNQYRYAVRRITPIEGERLQGFADGWTRPCFKPEDITDELVDRFVGIHQQWAAINGNPNAKPKSREWVRKWLMTISSAECPDGPRYKAIGNSMSTNVMNWIGRRIQEDDNKRISVG